MEPSFAKKPSRHILKCSFQLTCEHQHCLLKRLNIFSQQLRTVVETTLFFLPGAMRMRRIPPHSILCNTDYT